MPRKNSILFYYPYLALVVCVFLFFLFPLSGDDWNRIAMDRSSIYGYIAAIESQWLHLNGRILGNVFSMLWIGKSFRVIARLACVISFWLLISKVFCIRKRESLCFTLAIILLLPKEIFREVWVWNAGFYNYAPPLVLLLLIYHIVLNQPFRPKMQGVILFITSFACCLFLENITVYLFISSFGYTVFCLLTHREIKIILPCLLGATLGTLFMFMSPVYWDIVLEVDTYRTVGTKILRNWNAMARFLIASNPLFLVGTGSIFLRKSISQHKLRCSAAIYVLISIIIFTWPLLGISNELLWINFLLHIVFFALLIILGLATEESIFTSHFLFFVLSLGILMGQLLFVTPIGARNFMASTLIQMMILIELFTHEYHSSGKVRLITQRTLAVLISIKLIFLLVIYSKNYLTFLSRVNDLEAARLSCRPYVRIQTYPYPDYIHSPGIENLEKVYFCVEPGDITIELDNE